MPFDEFADGQAAASALGNRATDNGCATCHQGNWIHVRYDYTEGDPITDAAFVVQKPNDGKPVAMCWPKGCWRSARIPRTGSPMSIWAITTARSRFSFSTIRPNPSPMRNRSPSRISAVGCNARPMA